MEKILWLASWYPDKKNPFDGDFVQRHAKALSLYADLHVICIKPCYENHDGAPELKRLGRLTEEIRFYDPSSIAFVNLYRYMRLGIKSVKEYEKQNGKISIVHVHVLMKAGLLALWLNVFHKIPYVVTEHYNIYHPTRPDSFFKRSWFYRIAVKQILKRSNGLVSVSNYIASQLKQLSPNLISTWVPNCVDTSLFYPSDKSNSRFKFVHASTMQPVKNLNGMLLAVKQVSEKRKDFELQLLGPYTDEIKNAIDTLELNDLVKLYGEVSYAKVAEVMRSSDALVMFSHWENMPCNILEALCCGLPVIATNVGGIPEVVNDSNGILVNDNDVNGLVEAMNYMIENKSRYNSSKISANAIKQFSYEAIGKQFVDAYEKLIKP